jgi:decaprenyl-phosphate phosphoribosyltransferase
MTPFPVQKKQTQSTSDRFGGFRLIRDAARPSGTQKSLSSVRAYVQIARFDHWIKNVFVIPGVLVALTVSGHVNRLLLARDFLLGMLAIGLIASSNYVINEIMDAPFDRFHPVKCKRPIPSGMVALPIAYGEWLVLMMMGMGVASLVSRPLLVTLVALWIMGLLYNIPPLRSKDLPYVDVLSESINNPLRMLAGWYIVRPVAAPPLSLLLSYWMIGCFFMATKRFAEYREFEHPSQSSAYRRSFEFYNEKRLLVSIMFYASFAMLMLGAFIIRYRLECILAFPLVALMMAVYLSLAFKPDSAVQYPEGLYREPALLLSASAAAAVLTLFLFVDVPALYRWFAPLQSGLIPRT